MLWLRNEDLSALHGLKVGTTFMIDDLIYVMEQDGNQPSLMFSIDTDTFAVKRVPVVCHDFDMNSSDVRCDSAVVYKRVAYKYFGNQNEMVAGTVVGNEFHWRIVPTIGKPATTMSVSVGAIFANSAKYVMIVVDGGEAYKCELDLETMKWDRQMASCDDESNESRERCMLHFPGLHILATPTKLHGFYTDYYSDDDGHMVCDRSSARTSYAEYLDNIPNPEHGTVFSALNNLYSIALLEKVDGGRRVNKSGNKSVPVLFQFKEDINQWKKVCEFPATSVGMSLAQSKVVVNGSRVYIFGQEKPSNSSIAARLEYLMVFELKPSLYDHAQAYLLLQSEEKKQQCAAVLPKKLRSQLVRDTSCDHLLKKKDDKKNEDLFSIVLIVLILIYFLIRHSLSRLSTRRSLL